MSDALDTLSVDVNRTRLHSVEAPKSFETTGSFDIEFENHGESVHVHVHLDDALSAVADIEAVNHYLRPGALRRVPVAVHRDDRSAWGRLKIASAYGAETRYVDVSIDAVEPTKPPVEVDDSLTIPKRRSVPSRSQSSPSGQSPPVSTMLDPPVVVFGIVVFLLAIVAVVTIDSSALLVGVFALLAGVVFAGYLSGYLSLR